MLDNGTSEASTLGLVLVVDDEPHVRSGLVQALTFLGYDAEEAESGENALAQLNRRRHEAMLLDMEMPGMSGVEVMRAARNLDGDLAIVILTGRGTLESAIAAVRSGVADYLQKPASIEQIGAALAAAIAERRREQRTQSLLQAIGQAVHGLQELGAGSEPARPAAPRYLHGGALLFDREKRTVMLDGCVPSTIALSESEARILEALMGRPGQLMSCRQLAAEALAYDVEEYEAEGLVRPHIFRLRQRLERLTGTADMIRTVRGRGYMFAPR